MALIFLIFSVFSFMYGRRVEKYISSLYYFVHVSKGISTVKYTSLLMYRLSSKRCKKDKNYCLIF